VITFWPGSATITGLPCVPTAEPTIAAPTTGTGAAAAALAAAATRPITFGEDAQIGDMVSQQPLP